jgi:hypothetical protein
VTAILLEMEGRFFAGLSVWNICCAAKKGIFFMADDLILPYLRTA